MLFNKIEIDTVYSEVIDMMNTAGLENVFDALQISKPVIYFFVSDDELLEVNIDVLNHDYYTDIITFDYGDDSDIEQHEILISWDRIKENATTHLQTNHQELRRVCIHGLLHLAGYDDETDEEKQKMRGLETHFLNLHCST